MVGERTGSGLNSEHGQVTEEFFMTRDEMRARTKAYASRVVKLCKALPDEWVARTLGMQLLRSGTSVGANYRAVCRAKSTADFLNKLKIVEEECDEILSIVVASAKTTRAAQTS